VQRGPLHIHVHQRHSSAHTHSRTFGIASLLEPSGRLILTYIYRPLGMHYPIPPCPDVFASIPSSSRWYELRLPSGRQTVLLYLAFFCGLIVLPKVKPPAPGQPSTCRSPPPSLHVYTPSLTSPLPSPLLTKYLTYAHPLNRSNHPTPANNYTLTAVYFRRYSPPPRGSGILSRRPAFSHPHSIT